MSFLQAAIKMGAGQYAAAFDRAIKAFGIVQPLEQAHFLGQMHTESIGFTVFAESLNYSVEGLLATFGTRRISRAQAALYGRIDIKNAHLHPGKSHQSANQPAIANVVYGGAWGRENLGNTQLNDGWYFRGRGPKQITGRTNYTACDKALYVGQRLLRNPDLLLDPDNGADAAAWYWTWRKIGPAALRDDIRVVTRLVNGGFNGLEARKTATARAKIYLGVK